MYSLVSSASWKRKKKEFRPRLVKVESARFFFFTDSVTFFFCFRRRNRKRTANRDWSPSPGVAIGPTGEAGSTNDDAALHPLANSLRTGSEMQIARKRFDPETARTLSLPSFTGFFLPSFSFFFLPRTVPRQCQSCYRVFFFFAVPSFREGSARVWVVPRGSWLLLLLLLLLLMLLVLLLLGRHFRVAAAEEKTGQCRRRPGPFP